MKKIKIQKKAIAFPALMPMILIVFFALLFVGYFSPAQEVRFSDSVTSLSSLVLKSHADKMYKEDQVYSVLSKTKNVYTSSLSLSSSDLLERKDSIVDKLVGCDIGSSNLWYNQINVEQNLENQNSGSKTQYSNCVPGFKDIEKTYLTYLEKEIKKDFEQLDLNNVEMDFSSDTNGNYNLVLKTKLNSFGKDYQISSNYQIQKEISIKTYVELLETLTNLVPSLSDIFASEVPKCVVEKKLDQISCINIVFNNQINLKSPSLKNEYDFVISEIPIVKEKTSEQYYGLNVVAKNKKSGISELNFGLIYKNQIPESPIIFNVLSSDNQDNSVKISVQKPSYNDKVQRYGVLYSYEDFLSNTNLKYQKISEILAKSAIKENFKNIEISNALTKYYYSEELDMTLTFTQNNEGFVEVQNSKDISTRDIEIFQIYNSNTKQFEFLKKPIYVYVFAMGKSDNVLNDDFENKAVVGVPSSLYGPLPPSNPKDIVKGEILDAENSLLIQIFDYNDVSFDHFDIYVSEPGKAISKSCEGISTCHHFDGTGLITQNIKTPDGDYVFAISNFENSNSPLLQNITIIGSNRFSNSLVLENGKSYDVYVIPIDSSGRRTYSSIYKKGDYEIIDQKVLFRNFKNVVSPLPLKPKSFENIKVVDKLAPTISFSNPSASSVNIIEPKLNLLNGNIYLSWNSIKQNDVQYLSVKKTIYYTSGQIVGPVDYNIQIDGFVSVFDGSISKIEISNIVPIDYSKNLGVSLDSENVVLSYP